MFAGVALGFHDGAVNEELVFRTGQCQNSALGVDYPASFRLDALLDGCRRESVHDSLIRLLDLDSDDLKYYSYRSYEQQQVNHIENYPYAIPLFSISGLACHIISLSCMPACWARSLRIPVWQGCFPRWNAFRRLPDQISFAIAQSPVRL